MTAKSVPASFRDPSGSLFLENGRLFRRVNHSYRAEYDRLIESGLYDELRSDGLLIPHEEVKLDSEAASGAYKVVEPERIPFISYPYEWCFGQLKDAALLTLEIQKRALSRGMILKDASAYNVQFLRGKPALIDTLSFEEYIEGKPWAAYGQFCRHFLAPLALVSLRDARLNRLSRAFIDGIPIDLASGLLPRRTRLSFGLGLHIHLHAKSGKRFENEALDPEKHAHRMSRRSMLGLIDSLESCVGGLKWNPGRSEWSEYSGDDSYTQAGFEHKKALVGRYLKAAKPGTVWDLGANTGEFSRLACEMGAYAVSLDADPACVELNYRAAVKRGETNILPLVLDLTNPSPSIGWANEERMSLVERGPADTAMALALIHHLAIANNVPLRMIADFFARICSHLIVEFVPKSDPKARKLLATRKDIFPDYTQAAFESKFGGRFRILESEQIEDSERTLFLMVRR